MRSDTNSKNIFLNILEQTLPRKSVMVIFLTSERLSAPAVIDFGFVFGVTNYPPAVTGNPPTVASNRSSYRISEKHTRRTVTNDPGV